MQNQSINQMVIVLNFGGHSHLAARKVRALKVYCEMLPCCISMDEIKSKNPIGIICTGDTDKAIEENLFSLGIPMLGVECSQQLAEQLKKKKIECIDSTIPDGTEKLQKFLYETCKATGGWQMEDFENRAIADIRNQVGEGKVLLALSGGVDSSVLAALLAKAVGEQVTCIFVDHGFMRKNEGDEVEAAFKGRGLRLIRIDAEKRFLEKVAGISEPEQKRKLIGEEFIRVFEEEAKKLGTVDFLAQGTIYPDIIESGIGNSAVIKSHHNVGGLPDKVDFKELVEPFKVLFKDEVRMLGEVLGLPDYLVYRQPFPGPGLAIRVIGNITKAKLDILRDADAIYREEIAKANLDRKINQYFAVLTNMRSVGVKDNQRTYDYTLALRGVNTTDFMTAEWAHIPYELLDKISRRIISEVDGIGRIVYDITSKPPSTIEWE